MLRRKLGRGSQGKEDLTLNDGALDKILPPINVSGNRVHVKSEIGMRGAQQGKAQGDDTTWTKHTQTGLRKPTIREGPSRCD